MPPKGLDVVVLDDGVLRVCTKGGQERFDIVSWIFKVFLLADMKFMFEVPLSRTR